MKRLNDLTIATISKDTFSKLFMILAVTLMILPFVTTFTEFLTRIVENTFLYQPIQRIVVPYEIMLVRTILSLFGIETLPGQTIFQIVKDGVPQGVHISWNCVGWQSFVIFIFSLKTGLQKEFTDISRLKVVVIGVLGTFLFNLIRISFVILIFYFFGRLPAVLLHDYGSILITITWLFFFWWFAYSFVLETKEQGSRTE